MSKASWLLAWGIAGIVAVASNASAQLVSAAYLQQYNEATDYAPLLAAAAKDRVHGGGFYAHQIITECELVRKHWSQWAAQSKASGDAKDSPRAKAVESLGQRCEHVSAEQLLNLLPDVELSSGVPDPLLLTAQDMQMKASHVASAPRERSRLSGPDRTPEPGKRILIKLPKELHDPLFIQHLTGKWQVRDANGKPTQRVMHTYLRGSFRPGAEEVVGVAAYLVPCEMGLKCDEREFTVAQRCASGGACDASRVEHMRRNYRDKGVDFDNAISTTKELARSIKEEESARILVIW